MNTTRPCLRFYSLFNALFSLLAVCFLLLVLTDPLLAQTSVPGGGAAQQKFGQLAGNLQVFGGVLLLIGCVFAGIMFMTGKHQMAIMVFMGAAVIFGGSYVVGLIMSSLQ